MNISQYFTDYFPYPQIGITVWIVTWWWMCRHNFKIYDNTWNTFGIGTVLGNFLIVPFIVFAAVFMLGPAWIVQIVIDVGNKWTAALYKSWGLDRLFSWIFLTKRDVPMDERMY